MKWISLWRIMFMKGKCGNCNFPVLKSEDECPNCESGIIWVKLK